jgi:hypothetical protein
MLASWCRKLRQSPSASPAVHAVHSHAEPKRSTPFTYFQVHAQVVHFVPFQTKVLPRQASISSMVEWACLSCYGTPLACSQNSMALSITRQHSSVVVLCACSTLGKIESTLHPIHPVSRLQLLSSRLCQLCGSFAALVPIMESLKVIAFDKSAVNLNLSSGKQSAYIPH